MPIELTIQLALLAVTGLLFAAGFVLGFWHMRAAAAARQTAAASAGGLPHDASMGVPARAVVIAATALGAGLFAWRAASEGGMALAVSNPFDAFLALGLLLSLTVMYFRWTRHLRSLAFFLQPMIVILLGLGLVLAVIHRGHAGDEQNFLHAWTFIHLIAIITATICFALACVGGAVYLLADRQLRRKGLDASHRWIGLPPLASIEKFNRWMIVAGFPLLSIATVAGILRMTQTASPGTGLHVKIALGISSWLVYALLLYIPLTPSFRGRRAAWLSIIGFVLFIGAFAAAKWS
jgi:ABC-type uncharacterized transport system permease subunit